MAQHCKYCGEEIIFRWVKIPGPKEENQLEFKDVEIPETFHWRVVPIHITGKGCSRSKGAA